MANYKYLTDTGVIMPDTEATLADVQNDYFSVFGADLDITPDTVQGKLITVDTLTRDEAVRNNAALANQINPNEAGGVFLDAVCALTNEKRRGDSFSVANVTMTGVAGTLISIGAIVKHNLSGELFELTQNVSLDSLGAGVGIFQAINPGPVFAAPNTLTIIVSGASVGGWETATNPDAAILGVLQQSDSDLRAQRKRTLALQGTSMPFALKSALNDLLGVKYPLYRENTNWTSVVIDGVTLSPKSMYVCVYGGTDQQVAQIILSKKSIGAAYNNGPGVNKSVVVVDPTSGQSYTVLFDRPNLISILIRVTIVGNPTVLNPDVAIKNAILDYANGNIPDEPGFIIGAAVSCFELAGAINQLVPGIYLKNVETSLISPVSFSNAEIPIAVYEKADIIGTNISVVIL